MVGEWMGSLESRRKRNRGDEEEERPGVGRGLSRCVVIRQVGSLGGMQKPRSAELGLLSVDVDFF